MKVTGHDARAALSAVRQWSGDLIAIESATRLLHWDQETAMAGGAISGRAEVLGRMAALAHRELTRPDIEEHLLLLAELPADRRSADVAAVVREALRHRNRATRVPEALVREITETVALSVQAWSTALGRSSFADFAPHLERIVALRKEEAAHIDVGDEPYDALLDAHDPGLRTADVAPLLEKLAVELRGLLGEIPSRRSAIDWTPWIGTDLSPLLTDVATSVGYDPDLGGFARSTHPFCMRIHDRDVRLTTRRTSADPFDDILSTLHEVGHALYDQAPPSELRDTPIGEPISLAAHESQSRFYENHIGRSRAFWDWCGPRLRRQLAGSPRSLTNERLHSGVTHVEPSLIRTEADEVTYGLHIVLRMRLELRLFRGELAVPEIPEAWASELDGLLGLRPVSDAQGSLQDLHWAEGAFGYFPTYSLGDLYAAQLAEAVEREVGPIEDVIRSDGPMPITAFLRERVQRHAGRYLTPELMRRATGSPLDTDALVRHLRQRYVEGASV